MEKKEFEQRLYDWVKSQGVANELQTILRHRLITNINKSGLNQTSNSWAVVSPRTQALNLLVAEHLSAQNCHYSLSVLASEVPMLSEQLPRPPVGTTGTKTDTPMRLKSEDIRKLTESLGIGHKQQEKTIRLYSTSKDISLLSCLLDALLDNDVSRDVPVPAIPQVHQTLDEKLKAIEVKYEEQSMKSDNTLSQLRYMENGRNANLNVVKEIDKSDVSTMHSIYESVDSKYQEKLTQVKMEIEAKVAEQIKHSQLQVSDYELYLKNTIAKEHDDLMLQRHQLSHFVKEIEERENKIRIREEKRHPISNIPDTEVVTEMNHSLQDPMARELLVEGKSKDLNSALMQEVQKIGSTLQTLFEEHKNFRKELEGATAVSHNKDHSSGISVRNPIYTEQSRIKVLTEPLQLEVPVIGQPVNDTFIQPIRSKPDYFLQTQVELLNRELATTSRQLDITRSELLQTRSKHTTVNALVDELSEDIDKQDTNVNVSRSAEIEILNQKLSNEEHQFSKSKPIGIIGNNNSRIIRPVSSAESDSDGESSTEELIKKSKEELKNIDIEWQKLQDNFRNYCRQKEILNIEIPKTSITFSDSYKTVPLNKLPCRALAYNNEQNMGSTIIDSICRVQTPDTSIHESETRVQTVRPLQAISAHHTTTPLPQCLIRDVHREEFQDSIVELQQSTIHISPVLSSNVGSEPRDFMRSPEHETYTVPSMISHSTPQVPLQQASQIVSETYVIEPQHSSNQIYPVVSLNSTHEQLLLHLEHTPENQPVRDILHLNYPYGQSTESNAESEIPVQIVQSTPEVHTDSPDVCITPVIVNLDTAWIGTVNHNISQTGSSGNSASSAISVSPVGPRSDYSNSVLEASKSININKQTTQPHENSYNSSKVPAKVLPVMNNSSDNSMISTKENSFRKSQTKTKSALQKEYVPLDHSSQDTSHHMSIGDVPSDEFW